MLALGEYRESVGIDFLCSDRDGYRLLRNALTLPTLGALVTRPIKYRREVRTDRDKISISVEIDDIPIKLELMLEARIDLGGALDPRLKVPVLSQHDLYSEKLLANADRGLDRSTLSRDMIDLAMMINSWGPIPPDVWDKVYKAYGPVAKEYYDKSRNLMRDRIHLTKCMRSMSMDTALVDDVCMALKLDADQPELS